MACHSTAQSPNPDHLAWFCLSIFFVESPPQQSSGCVATWKLCMQNCCIPWGGSSLHGDLCSFQFLLPAHEFWVSCSVYWIDLIAFSLSSKAYFSVFNQHQGGETKAAKDCSWNQVAPLVTTLQLWHLLDNSLLYLKQFTRPDTR